MKNLYLIIIFIGLALLANAQSPAFAWVKNVGGTSFTRGNAVATDVSGNVYTAGIFSGTTDFDPGAGTLNLTALGDQDGFISKSDASGNLMSAVNIGGAYSEIISGIAVDASGNVYTTGSYGLTVDFDPGAGTFNMTSKGGSDVFILKLDNSGNFIWAKSIGGTSTDDSYGIALDASGYIYCTGDFVGEADFDPGSGILNLLSKGDLDIFVLKLDATGSLIWAKNMGGVGADAGYSIAVDAAGNVVSTGLFSANADFDPSAAEYEFINFGNSDMYISKLDASGNFVWAAQIGGAQNDYGYSIALDASGNVYTTGWFYDTADFDPGTGTFILSSATGSSNTFVSKLDASGNFVWADNIGGGNFTNAQGYGIAVDAFNNIYTTGIFQETTDFDPGTGIYNLTSAGYSDIFILKLNPSGNMEWAGALSGPIVEKGNAIAVNASSVIYCTGEFSGTVDFDPGTAVVAIPAIQSDAFVVKLAQSSTGIADNSLSFNISVYPNPALNIVYVNIPGSKGNESIEVHNSIGTLIYKLNNAGKLNTFDLSNQPTGLYFVQVIGNGNIIASKKIVKE